MKVFLIKTVCFILGFWFLSYSLGSLGDRIAPMNVYSKSQADRLKILLENKEDVQAISLGNSHSDALDFDTLGVVGHRLARAGTDLFEVKLYVDSVTPKLPKLETVFISISYFSFTNNNVLLEDTRNLRIESYGMLPIWTPLPGDVESFFLGKLHRYFRIMSMVRPDSWKNVFTSVLENKPTIEYSPSYSVKTKTAWGECSHFPQNELDAIGYEIAYKAATNHLKFLNFDPNIQVHSSQALADTIEMLQNRGVRVVLFTPPYYISYNNRFNETAPVMIGAMHKAINSLQTKYNLEYYDASTLEEFTTHPELFYNSDHLNECGKKAFSEYLLSEMKKQ